MDRALVSGTRGRAFESRIAHHKKIKGLRLMRNPLTCLGRINVVLPLSRTAGCYAGHESSIALFRCRMGLSQTHFHHTDARF